MRFQWASPLPTLIEGAARVHRLPDPDSSLGADPMLIKLRHVRPDAAAKLRQLEVGAAALDRAVRDLVPQELRQQLKSPILRGPTARARAHLRPVFGALRSSLASLERGIPYLAAALRILLGLLAEAVLCIALAFAVLLALALVITILAPPA
jgi:hypothetical protein